MYKCGDDRAAGVMIYVWMLNVNIQRCDHRFVEMFNYQRLTEIANTLRN